MKNDFFNVLAIFGVQSRCKENEDLRGCVGTKQQTDRSWFSAIFSFFNNSNSKVGLSH
jgi:AMMECR1 domain-containing protein